VTDCALTGMYLSTTSGDCTIDAVLQPGDFEARTVSGDLELRVQPDLAATLTGRTVSGSFRSDLPYRAHWERDEPGASDIDIDIDIDLGDKHWERRLHREKERRERRERQERRRARSRWEFVVGDPAQAEQSRTRLRVRTVSGDLSIKRRRGGAAGPVGVPTGRGGAAARESARPAAARHEGPVNLAQMVEGEGTMSSSDQEARATAQGAPPQPAPATGQPRGEGSWPDAELWPSREERERSRLEILQAVERKELSVEEAMLLLRELEDEAR
jgi:hypothetical protein